jgi:UDP-4-amino-4,6-dideoxy-N-acetyl-beta-L-altrosamine transaminase
MEFIPYSRQSITDDDIAAVMGVLRSEYLTQGPKIDEFEHIVAKYTGARHAVAVCNATAALHIACLALGVKEGDVVWTVPNSFVASANCARYCGATVDFVDIDAQTRNISIIELELKLREAETNGSLPKVVIPVDFAGYPCPLPQIRAMADRYGFSVIEDASHALGASLNGQKVGSTDGADICVLSFHAVKIITSGEGGMCLTNDDQLAAKLRLLRTHGITRDSSEMENAHDGLHYYEQITLGFNYRITDIQAALGISQMSRAIERQAERERLSQRYDDLLSGFNLQLPARQVGAVSAHHLYVVELLDENVSRERVLEYMRQNQIGVNVHYIPIHLHPDYARLGFSPGQFPVSENYYRRALTLPLFPEMNASQQDRVVATLNDALKVN